MTQTPDPTPTTTTPLDWVGKTYIETYTATRWLITAVEPCNEWFYRMTGADPSIPRWDVTVRRIRPGRPLGKDNSFALTAHAEVI